MGQIWVDRSMVDYMDGENNFGLTKVSDSGQVKVNGQTTDCMRKWNTVFQKIPSSLVSLSLFNSFAGGQMFNKYNKDIKFPLFSHSKRTDSTISAI